VAYSIYLWLRVMLALGLLVYACSIITRFASLTATTKKPGHIVEIIFWTLGPPLWFFLEYFAFDKERSTMAEGMAKKEFLEHAKTYGDYASKIWAAVLAVATFLYTKK
jgi:hypothetical protein